MAKPILPAVTGAGMWMIDLCIQLYSSAYPDQIKPHPYWISGLGLLGLILILYALLAWLNDRNKEGVPSSSPDILPSPVTATATASGNVVNLNVGPSEDRMIEIAKLYRGGVMVNGDKDILPPPPVSPSKPDVLDVPLAFPPKQESTNLGIDFEVKSKWADVVYDQLPGGWRVARQSDRDTHKAFLVTFTRPLPLKGEKANAPIELQAHIKIGFVGGNSEQNKHSYWLDQVKNKIWFSAGHEETVVVGMIEGQYFATYENPFEMGHGDFSVPVRILGERKIVTHLGRSVEVTISLFDSHKNCTVERVQFSVSIIQGLGMAVNK